MVMEPCRGRTMEPTRSGVMVVDPEPVGHAPDRIAGKAEGSHVRRTVPEESRRGCPKTAAARTVFQLVPESVQQTSVRESRVLQHGIHAERCPADLFRWSRQRGRRSAEGRQ